MLIVVAWVGVTPSAFATALASASLNIASFTWYVDVGGDGDISNDVPITAGNTEFDTADTYQFSGVDNVAALRSQPDAAVVAPAPVSVTEASNSTGQLCAPGSGCAQAPTNYLPLSAPYPTDTFYNAQAERNGQFVESLSDPGTGSLSGGVRADVSLTENETIEAETAARWSLTSSARVTTGFPAQDKTLLTYFRVEFEAQRLAEAVGAGSSASSDLFLQATFATVGGGSNTWRIIDTANDIAIPRDPILYSFDTEGYYSITNVGEPSYSIGIVARATASGSSTLPSAPTGLLLVTGLVWLAARRRASV